MPYQINDLKNMEDSALPDELHGRIMRKIYFLKFRVPFMFLIILSAVNLINSGWYFFSRAADMQTFSIINTLAGQFEFNFDYFTGLISAALENAPINLLLVFMINLIFISCLIYIINILAKFIKVEENLNY